MGVHLRSLELDVSVEMLSHTADPAGTNTLATPCITKCVYKVPGVSLIVLDTDLGYNARASSTKAGSLETLKVDHNYLLM